MGVARAKLLLLGEHAAVYGHPAVGCALPWPLTVNSSPASAWALEGLGIHESTVFGLVRRLEQLASEEALSPPPPSRLTFSTAIPLGSGFGSSGALCAALVNEFWGDWPLERRERLAWRAEALFHGTPSGIDTALALREGWWVLDASSKPASASPLPDPGLHLVVGAVVRESNTKELVGGLARRSGEPEVRAALNRLGELSSEAARRFPAGDFRAADLVGEAREGLRSLGLETPALTKVLDEALAGGALAAKLSGAGGGGAFLALYPSAATAEEGAARLSAVFSQDFWTAPPRVTSSGR